MYRLQTNFTGEYQVRDLDQETFASIATGVLVRADQEAQARHSDQLTVYTAVWNPDANEYVNNLAQEQVTAAFESWAREQLP